MSDSTATELALTDDDRALVEAATASIDTDDLILPLLKLAQGLTAEVADGNARAGQFVNSLTGEAIDPPVELVLVSHAKGRFFSPPGQTKDSYVAFDTPVAPDNWPPEYAGQHFADLADAEEQFVAAANAEGGEWGDGPPIRTTYNYIGFAVEDPDLPLRLSMQRTSKQTARKLNTLLKASAFSFAWTYVLDATRKQNDKGDFYVYEVRRGRKTTQEEQQRALELLRGLNAAEVKYHGDEAEVREDDAVDGTATEVPDEDALPVN